MIDLIAVFMFLGTTFAIFKMLLRQLNEPLFLIALCMLISGLAYLIYQLIFLRKKIPFSPKHIGVYLQLIVIAYLMPQVLRFWSLKYMSSIKLGLCINASPFITAAMAYVLGFGKLSARKTGALLLGLAGMLLAMFTHGSGVGDIDSLWIFSWPEIAGILSVVCFSYGFFVRRRMLVELGCSSEVINMIGLLGTGIIMMPLVLMYQGVPSIASWPAFITWLLLFIIVTYVLGHTLVNSMVKKYHPTLVSFAGFIRPLVIMAIGSIFLEEPISWHFFVSIVLVLLALVLYYKEDINIYSHKA